MLTGKVKLEISLASLVALLLYKKKTSGTEVRRTPDVKLRFVGFNFGQIQWLRFVVVMVQLNSFGQENNPQGT